MKRRDFGKSIALASLGFALGGCEMMGLEWRYRFRLVAEVTRKGRTYVGETIIQVVRQAGLGGAVGGYARGGALALDVGNAGTLFLLLSDPDGLDWPLYVAHRAFTTQLGGPGFVDHTVLNRLATMQAASAIVSPKDYPYFVRFDDPSDPASLVELDPDELDRHFGADTRLRDVRIEITKNEKATDIYRRLPWLSELRGALLQQPDDVSIMEMPLAARLTEGDFVRGVERKWRD